MPAWQQQVKDDINFDTVVTIATTYAVFSQAITISMTVILLLLQYMYSILQMAIILPADRNAL